MNNKNEEVKQRILMGQSVSMPYDDYKSAQAIVICTYCDPNTIKNVPLDTINSIKKSHDDLSTLEQQRVKLIATIRQIDDQSNSIRCKAQGVADVVKNLIDPDEFENLIAKAELDAIKDIEKANAEHQKKINQERMGNITSPEKEKVNLESHQESTPSDDKVVEGDFKNNNTSVAGQAGKTGVSDVVDEIEKQNRKSAVSKDIESNK